MKCQARRVIPVLTILTLVLQMVAPAGAADPEIDRLLRSPVGKDWITNGGNLTNQRYSTLKQIDTSNVTRLGLAWSYEMKTNRDPADIRGSAAEVTTKHESKFADIVARHCSKVCLRA